MSKVFKVNNKIYHLLIDENINNFTVKDLRSRYQACGFSSADPQKDRQFLYRQLFMLEEKGLLSKEGINHSRSISYQKTPLFFESEVLPLSNSNVAKINNLKNQGRPKLEELKQSLYSYQVKFVSSMSESEEYLKVIEKFPCLRSKIQPNYYQTRENTTRYLGKINALKRIIQAYQS